MDTQLPKELFVGDDYSIQEPLSEGGRRVLLRPADCYLNDPHVDLEGVIREIVRCYNRNATIRKAQGRRKGGEP